MKKIVFLGGGHANTLTIRNLMQKIIRNNSFEKFNKKFKFYLISEYDKSAYSGMIPGTICGYYSKNESFIDLRKFAEIHNCELITKCVESLDPKNKKLKFEDHSEIEYDLLSINVGSTTFDGDILKGANEYALKTRPINKLIEKIELFDELIHEKLKNMELSNSKISIGVIGGGVAGIELAFALKYRYKDKFLESNATIFSRGDNFIYDIEKNVGNHLTQLAIDSKIHIIRNSEVIEIRKNEVIFKNYKDSTIKTLNFDFIVLATGAAPQTFNYKSNLSTDKKGFILVNNTLQSIDYPDIFGAGDCIQIDQYKTNEKIFPPKSGVYAVREAAILTENIFSLLADREDLVSYIPQDCFLKLITMGDKFAFGTKLGIGFYGKWVWNLKEFIDVNFVNMFAKELTYDKSCTFYNLNEHVEFSFDPAECFDKLINSIEENNFTIQLKILDRLNSDSKLLGELKKFYKLK